MIRKMLQSTFYQMQKLKDKLKGVDFATALDNEEIGISNEEGVRYAPTTPLVYHALKKLLQNVTNADSIIDVGCGKGRMLEFFCAFPFKNVDGLEYSLLVGEIAIRNVKHLRLRSQIYVENAAIFTGYDEYNYFYLFNPFPSIVMVAFLKHLEESLERKPREIVLIYLNPVCRQDLLEHGFHEDKTAGKLRKGLAVFKNTRCERNHAVY